MFFFVFRARNWHIAPGNVAARISLWRNPSLCGRHRWHHLKMITMINWSTIDQTISTKKTHPWWCMGWHIGDMWSVHKDPPRWFQITPWAQGCSCAQSWTLITSSYFHAKLRRSKTQSCVDNTIQTRHLSHFYTYLWICYRAAQQKYLETAQSLELQLIDFTLFGFAFVALSGAQIFRWKVLQGEIPVLNTTWYHLHTTFSSLFGTPLYC